MSPRAKISFPPMPDGVLLSTCESLHASLCSRVPAPPDPAPPPPGPGLGGLASLGFSSAPKSVPPSSGLNLVSASGRVNTLPQCAQRFERVGFSTPQDGQSIAIGWPEGGYPRDYPAPIHCQQALSFVCQAWQPHVSAAGKAIVFEWGFAYIFFLSFGERQSSGLACLPRNGTDLAPSIPVPPSTLTLLALCLLLLHRKLAYTFFAHPRIGDPPP